MKKIVERLTAILFVVILTFQVPLTAMAETKKTTGGIVDSSVSVENQKSNFEQYSEDEWEEVFPNGTFVVEYPQYTVNEGDGSGSKQDSYLNINVARFGGKNTRCTVEYMITDVTTQEGDVETEGNTIVFEPGEEMKTIPIKIVDNLVAQQDRYFAFTLVDAGDGHIGEFNRAAVKIVDDEPYIPSVVTMSAPKTADKGDGSVDVTLRRTAGVEYYFTVDLNTKDGLAKSDVDYLKTNTTVVFEPGEVEKTVSVALIHDDVQELEADKEFAVQLSNPKGGSIEDGSEKLIIGLTNIIPDPTYQIVNSESIEKELGKNDKSDNASLLETDLTDNNSELDVNSDLTTKDKIQMFFKAVNVGAVYESGSYTNWTETKKIFDLQTI